MYGYLYQSMRSWATKVGSRSVTGLGLSEVFSVVSGR